ncbi:GSCOCG00000581001-RA-CDS [Cotesia congregata]|uniref:DDRGK domain-containing protein 1 n=1 Tax=Cotesia congregata TaxID=51543 RepID=A0A8J2H9D7_COTCN|nr:GSCOCG00000581001-RA-CDS [Cotesia congregata]CAG5087509.1 Similar to CPIJ007479: DDRGK domain-containing protein 1 (Culex quinquefasciatus) [Cotesia congregata]
MDTTILISIAVGIVTLIIFLTIWSTRSKGKSVKEDENPRPRGQPVRRAAGVRNPRRMQHRREEPEPREAAGDGGSEDEGDEKAAELPDGKIGAKKRAKLEAKAEKKQAREAMEREREERKKREHMQQEEADKQRERERAEELKQEELEKKAREEKEKAEYEEYLKMKEAFSVEEEGFDQNDVDEENLLDEFIKYIQYNKVVVLEDLAGHFNLKTASVIERIQSLQASGRLTGVVDDRGKFIYISQKELEAVAKFVKQRGRVSIAELAENSNRLISLTPGNQTVEAN